VLNTPEFYTWLGCAAAKAKNRGDESLYAAHRYQFSRAKGLERTEFKSEAERLYNEAFTAKRNIPKPEYFK